MSVDMDMAKERDWLWAYGALWDKNSTERCAINIPDTVFCKSDGEPEQYYFTAKDGRVKKMGKEKLRWQIVKDRFLAAQAEHNSEMNRCTGSHRKFSEGYVALARIGNAGKFSVKRLDYDQFQNFFGPEGSDDRSKCCMLQSYVPVKCARTLGTVYRTELKQPKRDQVRMQTYKMLYQSGAEGMVMNEKGQEVPADQCQLALKCKAENLKAQLHAMSMTVVKYIEAHKRCHVCTVALEYMVDELHQFPSLTHITSLATAAPPRAPAPDKNAIAAKANSSMSRMLSGPLTDGSGLIDKKPTGELYELLDKKTRSHRRRKQEDEEVVREENTYLLPLKSVLLARLDEAMARENESPRYRAVRHMAVAEELSKLDPAHFYRNVKVGQTHYRTYNTLDEERKVAIQEGKRIVREQKAKAGRRASQWWRAMEMKGGRRPKDGADSSGYGTPGGSAESAKMFDERRAKLQQLCKALCRNDTLCKRLCMNTSAIKQSGELPKLLRAMVGDVVSQLRLYDPDADGSSEFSKVSIPSDLVDSVRWRRDVTPTFVPSGYGSKTEDEVMVDSESKLERARARRGQHMRSQSSMSMGGFPRLMPGGRPPRSESAPPGAFLPDIDGSRRGRMSHGGAPRLHTGQRSVLPVMASSPAITASQSSSYNFPKTIPSAKELRSRHSLDTSSAEYQTLYDELGGVPGGGDGAPAMAESPPRLADAAPADEAPSAHGAAHAAVAAAADSGLYVSDTPVAGNYLRVDASTTVKYQILTVAGERPGAPLHLAVFNDFFETYEKYAAFFTGLLLRMPGGSKVLLFNLPGQAHTAFEDEALLNNSMLARCFEQLVAALESDGSFSLQGEQGAVVGVGNGANVASYWLTQTQVAPSTALLVNPFCELDAHLSLVLQNWLNTCDVSQLFQFDLQLYFFSHLLFSEKYLSECTPTVAFEKYSALPNPISVPGRAALCRGAQSHEPIQHTGRLAAGAADGTPPTAVVVVRCTDDNLIRGKMAAPLLAQQGGESKSLAEVKASGGVHVIDIEAGHEVFQELESDVSDIILRCVSADGAL